MSTPQGRVRDAFGRYLDTTTPHSDACPDCDAEVRTVEVYPGVFRLTVMHDASCPTYRRIRSAS